MFLLSSEKLKTKKHYCGVEPVQGVLKIDVFAPKKWRIFGVVNDPWFSFMSYCFPWNLPVNHSEPM